MTFRSWRGLSASEIQRTPTIEVIPGGGTGERVQDMEMYRSTLTFTIDKNSVSTPLLAGKEGQRIFFDYGPDGNASGNEKQTGSALISNLSFPANYEGKIQYQVTARVDGDITYGTY